MTDDNAFAARVEGNEIVAGIIHDLQRQLAEAKAECARYRAALEQIANRDDNEMVAARTLHYDMRGRARAALEGT
jgi:hypothetical protein